MAIFPREDVLYVLDISAVDASKDLRTLAGDGSAQVAVMNDVVVKSLVDFGMIDATVSTAAPGSPSAYDLWYDTTTHVLKYYTGATWASADITAIGNALGWSSGGTLIPSGDAAVDVGTAALRYRAGYFADIIVGGNGDTSPTITVNGASGSRRELRMQSGGVTRWAVRTDNHTETGSEIGSNFEIEAYDDAGGSLGLAMEIIRDDGQIILAPSRGSVKIGSPSRAASVFLSLDASTTASHQRGISYLSNGVVRWNAYVGDQEGGANSGSNYVLRAYNDAGSFLFDAFSIIRSTGLTRLCPDSGYVEIGQDSRPSSAQIYCNAAAGQNKNIGFMSNGVLRWYFSVNGAETGSNAGADLDLFGCTDVGDATVTLTINRSTRVARYNGSWRPFADNTQTLGFTGARWSVVYAGSGTINTSDATEKTDIRALSAAEKRVAEKLKGLVRRYRFKDAVKEKGDDARYHIGVIAQDVAAAFESEKLDAGRYALYCSDTFVDEQTGETVTRLGIRYDELVAFILAAM